MRRKDVPLPAMGKRKRRQYDTKLLSLAFKDIQTEGYSVYKAARIYGVPESTLRDRTLGNQPVLEGHLMPTAGPGSTLTRDEEKRLIDHMNYMTAIGYGYSRKEFLRLSTDFAVSIGHKKTSDPPFSQAWFEGLKRRWPAVRLAKPQKLAIVRAKCASTEVIDKYYQELESVMSVNNILNSPENVFNIDETGITVEHTPTKIVCSAGSTPQAVTSTRGKTITIIGCGNAIGNRLPPFYVFPGKRWNSDLMKNTCPGSSGCMTESGWSNTEVFLEYLETHFKKYVPMNGETKLILFDGHKSHVNLTLTEWGKKNNVVFFVLPPHTSHITQPLDVGCFGPLKCAYNRECQSFLRQHPGQQISRYDVGALSSKAYNKSMTADNLISGFRKTGIFPLCKSSIQTSKLAPSAIYQAVDDTTDKENQDFLDSRKIVVALTTSSKQRKRPDAVVGSLSTTHNQEILQKPKPNAKRTLSFTSQIKVSLKQKKTCKTKPSGTSQVDAAVRRNTSPQPSTSGITAAVLSDDETTDDEIINEEDLCCVCKKHNADGLNIAYALEFIKWAQCDKCNHWTHLKYCTRVRCVRRGSEFLCPHCDQSTKL